MHSQTSFFPSRTARIIALLIIFAFGIAIRIFDITDLPLEFHSTRQMLSALKARGMYYETRTDPDDEDVTQIRKHETSTKEFRGLDYTHAATLVGAYTATLKTITRTLSPIGGGGYTVTQVIDSMPSDVWNPL